MFVAGTLGTVIGDHCSHNMHLGDAWSSLLLGSILAFLFFTARNAMFRSLLYYWLTIVGEGCGHGGRRSLRRPKYIGTFDQHAAYRHPVRRAAVVLERTRNAKVGACGLIPYAA
jgi:hypothetical protein